MTRTELSAEPETTRSAVGLNRKAVTGKSCAFKIVMIDYASIPVSPPSSLDSTPGGRTHPQVDRVQDADAQIRAPKGEQGASGTDIKRGDGALTDDPRLDELPRLDVPHAHEALLLPRPGLPRPDGRSGVHDRVDVVPGREATKLARAEGARELLLEDGTFDRLQWLGLRALGNGFRAPHAQLLARGADELWD